MNNYNQGYNFFVKIAGLKEALEIGLKTKGWEDSPEIIGGVPIAATGAGALGLAGATEYAARKADIVSPDALASGRKFKALKDTKLPAHAALAQYAQHGSNIAKNTAITLPDGQKLTGRNLVEKTRSGDLGKILSSSGITNEFTPDSVRHYDEFSKGPAQAAQEMFRESFTDVGADFRSDTLGVRYNAVKDLIEQGVTPRPEDIERYLRAEGGQFGPAAASAERLYAQKAPDAYAESIDRIRAGADPSRAHNTMAQLVTGDTDDALAQAVRRAAGGDAGLSAINKGTDVEQLTALQRMFGEGADEPLLEYAASKMAPVYKKNIDQYERLIDPLDSFEKIRKKVRKGGRGLGALGALGLGVGGLLTAKGTSELGDVTGFGVGT